MTVYAESSAVLTWLLGEARADEVRGLLASADRVVTSVLTLVECDRAIWRIARASPRGVVAEPLRLRFETAVDAWAIEPITERVLDRARATFPDDAIRSLDAIHLATALVVGAAVGELNVLSLDERVRANAAALGFRVVPD